MKRILFVLLTSLALFHIRAFAQSEFTAISKALGDGNASGLSAYLDKQLEIAILDREETYSKEEAVQVLKNFFSTNRPSTFNQVHQGSSKGQNAKYCIGNLVAQSGTFRVYIYLKMFGDKYRIQELRFDKE